MEKFIGDAVMAVFGAPIAHGDDPERAVRAALAIRDAIGELNDATPGLELKLRIAVNTGEVLVRSGAERGEGWSPATSSTPRLVCRRRRRERHPRRRGDLPGDALRRSGSRRPKPVVAKGKAVPFGYGARSWPRRAGGADEGADGRPLARARRAPSIWQRVVPNGVRIS